MTSKPEFDSLRGPPSLVHSLSDLSGSSESVYPPKPHYEKGGFSQSWAATGGFGGEELRFTGSGSGY
jgi:hypothetical protein